MRGETIAATVKRLRLNRAAADLANTALDIGTIAVRSGYPNVQSFTRNFKAVYGMPPAAYRRQRPHTEFERAHGTRSEAMYDVTIKQVPALRALSVQHLGPYMEINRAFDRLCDLL